MRLFVFDAVVCQCLSMLGASQSVINADSVLFPCQLIPEGVLSIIVGVVSVIILLVVVNAIILLRLIGYSYNKHSCGSLNGSCFLIDECKCNLKI